MVEHPEALAHLGLEAAQGLREVAQVGPRLGGLHVPREHVRGPRLQRQQARARQAVHQPLREHVARLGTRLQRREGDSQGIYFTSSL